MSLVVTRRQTAGRGRQGRQWESPEGNVFWSLILRPEQSWPNCGTLPFVAGLAVHKTLREVTGSDSVAIKWPNDTLLNGKKISGALLEGAASNVSGIPAWMVVGIGINVSHHPEGSTLYPTTSLTAAGFPKVTRNQVIHSLTANFITFLNVWKAQGYSGIRTPLEGAIARMGQRITVRGHKKDEEVSGIFSRLDEHGRLMLLTDDGKTLPIVVGDLFLNEV